MNGSQEYNILDGSQEYAEFKKPVKYNPVREAQIITLGENFVLEVTNLEVICICLLSS